MHRIVDRHKTTLAAALQAQASPPAHGGPCPTVHGHDCTLLVTGLTDEPRPRRVTHCYPICYPVLNPMDRIRIWATGEKTGSMQTSSDSSPELEAIKKLERRMAWDKEWAGDLSHCL